MAAISIFLVPMLMLTFVEILQNSEVGELLAKKMVLFYDPNSSEFLRSIGNAVYCIIKQGLAVGLGFALVNSSMNLYEGIKAALYVTIAFHVLFLVATSVFDSFSTFKKTLVKKYLSRKIIYAVALLLYTVFMQFVLPQLLFSFPDSI